MTPVYGALHVLAAPVVLAGPYVDDAAYQLLRERASLTQPQQRGRVDVVEPIPLVHELLIEKDAEASQQHRVHVGIDAAVIVERQNAEQVAVAIGAAIALAIDVRMRL